jgi:hypothetical protein
VTRRSIRPWLAGLAVALAAAATAIAGAAEPPDPSFELSATPARVRVPGTTALVYRLRMTTGAEAERFAVDLVPPLFQTRLGAPDNVRREGATITPEGPVTLEGPGKLTPAGEGMALAGCSPSTGLAAHGYEARYRGFVVELPASSVATLVARYRTGGVALWPGSDLRLTMRASNRTAGYGAATLAEPVEVRSPAIALSGRTASRIELWTSPQSSPGVLKRLRRLPAGSRLQIGGRVTPARAGRRVSLWLLREGEGERARRLATVRTDATGHLELRTRTPARAGSYEVWARTPSAAGARPEHSCSMAFRIAYAG